MVVQHAKVQDFTVNVWRLGDSRYLKPKGFEVDYLKKKTRRSR